MIDTTDRPCYQYYIEGLHIVQMCTLPADRPWLVFNDPEDGPDDPVAIAIKAGLSERDRRRALANALAELVGSPTTDFEAGAPRGRRS
jgi:hypothetical protein